MKTYGQIAYEAASESTPLVYLPWNHLRQFERDMSEAGAAAAIKEFEKRRMETL